MKKLLLILLCLPLLFTSCKKEDEDSPFAGIWSGTYTGFNNDDSTSTSGSWQGTISTDGSLSGTIISDSNDVYYGTGNVTNNGSFSAAFGTTTSGASFVGTLTGNSGSGTWNNGDYNGTWIGYNYNQ